MKQRLASFAVATAMLAALPAAAGEIRYGIEFEPVTGPDGTVSVTIRNLSKLPVSVNGLSLTAPGATACGAPPAPVTVGPGESKRVETGCRLPDARAGVGSFLSSLRVAPQTPTTSAPPALKLGAKLDRQGQRHDIDVSWTKPTP